MWVEYTMIPKIPVRPRHLPYSMPRCATIMVLGYLILTPAISLIIKYVSSQLGGNFFLGTERTVVGTLKYRF